MSCINPLKMKTAEGAIKTLPCRHCVGCQIKKIQDLRVYAQAEMTFRSFAGQGCSFVRLSYDDVNLPVVYNGKLSRLGELVQNGSVPVGYRPTLLKSDFQKFMKRLRQIINRKYDGRNIKYIYCGEYGEKQDATHRSHYHICLFGLSPIEAEQLISKVWTYGLCDYKPLEAGAVRYISKYMFHDVFGKEKELKYTQYGVEPPFLFHSKHLGSNYLISCEDDGFMRINGNKMPLPYYYRKKYGISLDKMPNAEELRQYFQEAVKKSEEYIVRARQRACPIDDTSALTNKIKGVPVSELVRQNERFNHEK